MLQFLWFDRSAMTVITLSSSFPNLQYCTGYIRIKGGSQLHNPAFLELLKTFLKRLAKYVDFRGAESKTELSFSLSRTISQKSALSKISGMGTLG
jgi:hypothetical protein